MRKLYHALPGFAIYLAILLFFLGTVNPVLNGKTLEIYLRQAALWFPALLGQGLFMVMGVYNLSVGAQMTLVAAGVCYLQALGVQTWLAWLAVLLLSGVLGYLYGMVKPYVNLSLFTFACQYVMVGPASWIYIRASEKTIPAQSAGTVAFWGIGTLLVGGAIYLYLNCTTWGRSLSLAVQAEKNHATFGMKIRQIYCVACVAAALLVGVSGIALFQRAGMLTNYVSLDYTYRVFMAMAIGNCIRPTRRNLVWKAAVGSMGLVLVNALCQHFGMNSTGLYWVCGAFILCTYILKFFKKQQKK